jgi:type IX secretion system PorP/SprF family membrane protein
VRKQLYILFFILVVISTSKAQQFPIYSQYWTNKFLLNPAVAGHEGYTSFNLTARKQWAGLEGSPGTVAVSGQTRLVRNSHISRGKNVRKRRKSMTRGGKVGVGGYVFTDDLGAINKTGFQGTYAYHISLSKSQLSFGASLVGMQYHLNKDEITTDTPDELINASATNGYVFDGNFGVYYSDRNMYGGFSSQNLFESFFKLNNSEGSAVKLEREYLFIGGYRYDFTDDLFIEPSFNLKLTESLVSQIDLNFTTYIKEDYWAGLAYRSGSSSVSSETTSGSGSSIIIYGGARVDKFYFGYSFDYTLSSIQSYTYGSHEIMVAVKIGDNARRYRWLNRY